ncbi:MAG TPA: aminotransferase class V-fold PLP-dependent enzyme, partial [Micromonosporaceae bacterium]|nr:aminotransferase class V-fold PLP-dependent enzyme [Micromonosporaceae bacterium]
FVDPIGHRYLDDPVAREEGGTPAIVESIRAGLVFAVKQAVGTDLIQAREERLWRRALDRWQRNPHLEILGNPLARRLSIVSFRIRNGSRYLHHNFVVAVLNDLFGIQSRGGCSCAGPYGHRLLAIDATHSHAFRDEVGHGCDGIKPGWTRVNFNYFITDTVRDYLIDAVDLVATHGHRLLADYRFDPHTGLWRHRAGPTEPQLRMRDLRFDPDGRLTYPRRQAHAGEEVLAGYLDQARARLAAMADRIDDGPTGLPDDFEALRWFHLPPACLTGPPPAGPISVCAVAQPASP